MVECHGCCGKHHAHFFFFELVRLIEADVSRFAVVLLRDTDDALRDTEPLLRAAEVLLRAVDPLLRAVDALLRAAEVLLREPEPLLRGDLPDSMIAS